VLAVKDHLYLASYCGSWRARTAQRKHLFEVVQSGSLKEYEALCDLRDKFNEYPNLDTVEAPELQDSKKHYQSNKSFLK
jgi:hypothetical protein